MSKRKVVEDKVGKLVKVGFIQEIMYLTWLANIVMVKKKSGKWRMCVNFTDLNKACPKDSYSLLHIYRLIDRTYGFLLLSLLDSYLGYNQIRMNPLDATKMMFVMNMNNYYYEVIHFGLQNARATYHRLTNMVFASQIGRNLKVYMDDMLIKIPKDRKYAQDLEETFASIRSYNMRLNLEKCTFRVQARKFLGFMLTSRGIEAKPDKCQAIINMRSLSTLKEVQQLTGYLVALSHFLSCVGDKSINFFATMRKSTSFQWTKECENAFK